MLFILILQNFYKDINREAMYIRYLNIVPAYAVHASVRGSGCVHTSVRLHNLTRDYKSSTELMSKAMGSAVSLTGEGGGGAERAEWRNGGRQDDSAVGGGGDWGAA